MKLRFALNHRVAPRRSLSSLFDLAHDLGMSAVEIRNDLDDMPILDGTPAETVKKAAAKRGVTILSINALQRFNDWTPERATQAAELTAYAAACAAKALVLCPVNDLSFTPKPSERLAGLRHALAALAPMLRRHGLIGLVEPLGFVECSLRLKREAVEAIDDSGTGDTFLLVHDTFHHHVAGESDIYPARTGLVHVSGVADPTVPTYAMRDPDRVLVTRDDRIDNIGQIGALLDGGYDGPFSFEPFAESVSELETAYHAVAESRDIITGGLAARSAARSPS